MDLPGGKTCDHKNARARTTRHSIEQMMYHGLKHIQRRSVQCHVKGCFDMFSQAWYPSSVRQIHRCSETHSLQCNIRDSSFAPALFEGHLVHHSIPDKSGFSGSDRRQKLYAHGDARLIPTRNLYVLEIQC